MDKFLSSIESNGCVLAPACSLRDIQLSSNGLQGIYSAILPAFMVQLYEKTGGLSLGDGYIFGPKEFSIGTYPVPTILEINKELGRLKQIHGKTIFGRNDIFWFAFDVYGKCYMLDNLNLIPVREYEDPWRTMFDCLIVGKM